MLKKHTLIRTIYLYLFSLVGLFILVFGAIGLVKVGLNIFVFKEADQDLWHDVPKTLLLGDPTREEALIKEIEICSQNGKINEKDRASLEKWLLDYQKEKESREKEMGAQTERRRQRQIVDSLAMIIVGLPLFLYHWGVIRKDIKQKNFYDKDRA